MTVLRDPRVFWKACIVSTALVLIYPWLPFFTPIPYLPCLAVACYCYPFEGALWKSAFLGLMLDLLAIETHFGFYACNYVVCTFFCYRYKHWFFEDHLSTLPLLTALFSLVTQLLHILWWPAFGHTLPSLKSILFNLPFNAWQDSLAAVITYWAIFGRRKTPLKPCLAKRPH